MYIFERRVPQFLISRPTIIRTILFTAIFALAFLNIYTPFGVTTMIKGTKFQLFLYSNLAILTGMLVIVVSRLLMFLASRKSPLTYFGYSIWIFVEIVSMASFYALFDIFYLRDAREPFDIAIAAIRNTALVILLPYSMLWLYFSYYDKVQQLKLLQRRPVAPKGVNDMLPFFDEKGTLRFSIKSQDLLYIEASDNYITIHYYDTKNKLSKYLVRNTLKKLESHHTYAGLLRCHRSFMVNFEKVKVMQKTSDGLILELHSDPSIQLPVSKTYVPGVINAFTSVSFTEI